jgi:exopolysaccharide production protein ExoY
MGMRNQTTSSRYRVASSLDWKLTDPPRRTSEKYGDELKQHPIHIDRPKVAVGGSCKRAFDICAAAAALIFLTPLICLLAALIKIADSGPVLYRSERIGRNSVPFRCLKFRTMVTDSDRVLIQYLASNPEAAEEWEQTRKLKNDPRITPFGLILRKTSLDELPQLYNILLGEMSFVGPRPIVAAEVPKYNSYILSYYRTRPGLTGAWQVSGRNDISFEHRVALDHEYVENWSFMSDIAIIIKTFRVVITARGCY